MAIGIKRTIPNTTSNYHSKWTGKDIDNMVEKIATSFDSGHIIIPSTEAAPYNIDCLLEIGNYSIEYVVQSVLPSTIVENEIRPYRICNTMVNEVLHQILIVPTAYYIRIYDADNPMPDSCCDPSCNCDCNCYPKGTWGPWEINTIKVPEDVVCSIHTPEVDPIEDAVHTIDAEFIILQHPDGSTQTLQEYYNSTLTKKPSDENGTCDPSLSTTIRSDEIMIKHRGMCISLLDILDKILM